MRSTLALVPVDPALAAVGVLDEALDAVARLDEFGMLEGADDAGLLAVTAALHRCADRVAALAAELARRVQDRGAARAGGFASTARFLEVHAGLGPGAALGQVARGAALTHEFPATRVAWLGGQVSAGAVGEITRGITRVLRGAPAEVVHAERARMEAAALVVASTGTVAEVRRLIARLAVAADPGTSSAAVLAAGEAEFLRLRPAPGGVEVAGFLSTETAAAVLTALDQTISAWHRTGTPTTPDPTPGPGGPAAASRPGLRAARREHLLARALGELAGGLLDTGALGGKHGQRPHITVTVHADEHHHGLGGHLLLPGLGTVPVPSATISRILCDAEIHPVLTYRDPHPIPDPADQLAEFDPAPWLPKHPPPAHRPPQAQPPLDPEPAPNDAAGTDADWLAQLIGETGRRVLDVGRTYRTAPPRLRTALEVRDHHCAFPNCRTDTSRCQAHHITHWENGGPTSLTNLILLCGPHHRMVHEGGWTITTNHRLDPGDPDHHRITPPLGRRQRSGSSVGTEDRRWGATRGPAPA